MSSRRSKKFRVPSDRGSRIEPRPVPEGIISYTEMVARSNPKTSDEQHDVFTAFLNQFRYKPDRRQDSLRVQEKKIVRKPRSWLTSAEKRSDKYRRVPLDQLVLPPRSPHKLLQEEHASDPWKVIVICILLNLTQGKQVSKILGGFFSRYPDAQTAYHADTGKMAEYLTPLGLQRVKAEGIQRFSKEYLETEWTHVTDLHGVGKYAADAYAIFCAGRATEVVPEDHKLVDYWKYVCKCSKESQKPQQAT